MVIWGAIWGAILGVLWPGHGDGAEVVFGAVFGALAGWTLRTSVRAEVARQQQAVLARLQPAAPLAEPAADVRPAAVAIEAPPTPFEPAQQPAAPREFIDTQLLPEPAAAPTVRTPAAPPEPGLADVLVQRARDWLLGGNTVVRVGVLVLFVGLAFLAKYAIDNALLPPQLRLAAIAVAGIALLLAGLRLRARAPERLAYALTLQGAGVAVLYLTIFTAFRLYHFLPTGAAFAALALVCLFSTIIAVAQNALPLAFIGFAGAFAAPVLVSTGAGDHVALFGYYLMLGIAIAAIAWLKAWRALNLLGFFATFGVATAWGVLRYRPEQLPSTEPFLVAFFLVYLVAALFYALRHGHGARKAIDATLVFGTPLIAFGLQAGLVRNIEYATAFSALAVGASYVAIGWWLVRRRDGDATVNRWLAECCAALAFGFITLAVPLALDGRWTSAVWAVEGAAVYWMGQRQQRWLPRAAGLALQVLAALMFSEGLKPFNAHAWPIANPDFIGATMLAGAALAIAWWMREAPGDERSALATEFGKLEAGLAPFVFWAGFLWWQFALGLEFGRMVQHPDGYAVHVFAPAPRILLHMIGYVASAFALHHLALPARRRPWPVAATPSWLTLPVMLLAAFWGMATLDHVFQGGGWLAWPLALVLHAILLRRLDAGAPQRWWPWVHGGGVWLLVLLAGNLLVFAIDRGQLWRTAWASVVLLVAGSSVLLLLARQRWHAAPAVSLRWPLDRFARAYLVGAALPLAVALAAGALLVAVRSDGNARPLPYVPLLNPTDLAVALALGACAMWSTRVRRGGLALPAALRGPAPVALLAALAFIAVNTVWLRTAHHYAGVPWDAATLFSSFLVQAGYSILWTLIALALMVGAYRRALRLPWMLGAGLLALTVLKLFVIDLSNRGGGERIVVFIAVGLLMLVVGWFAPLPPAVDHKLRAAP